MSLSGPLSNSLTCDFNGECGGTPPYSGALLTDLISSWNSFGYDLVGDNHLGRDGAVGEVPGKVNTAFDFEDGDTSFYKIEAGSTGEILATGTSSWAMWVKPESLPGNLTVYDKNNRLRMTIDSSGQANARMNNGSVTFAAGMVAGNWYHIAVTANGGSLRLYVGGVLVNTASITAGPVDTAALTVGATNTPSSYFDGAVDQLSMWHRVLDATDVAELYNSGDGIDFTNGFPGPPSLPVDLTSGLLCCYSGSATDSSGNGATAWTPVNAPGTTTGRFGNTCMQYVKTSSQRHTMAKVDADPLFNFSGGTVDGSMSFWTKPDTLADFLGIFDRGNVSLSRIFLRATGTVLTARMGVERFKRNEFTAGQWAHVYMGWDASALTFYLSVNGGLATPIIAPSWPASGATYTLGAMGTGDYYNGGIDQFSSWDRLLNYSEIEALWNNGAGTNFTNLT